MNNLEFKDLGLSQAALDAVRDMGYEKPTQIQQQAIPPILAGRDVIGHSKTGTGKTMAFGLPAIEMTDAARKAVQVLVLCPTRELAEQVAGELSKAAAYHGGLRVTAVYGGASMERQISELGRGAQIVVGTPGRIMDHMRRSTLKLDALKLLVLDEADEMLNMGFREDIEVILQDVPEERITVLFSATMSGEIIEITKNYQKDAVLIKSADQTLTVAEIDQWYVHIKSANKTAAVEILLKYHSPKLTLIFCNTKKQVDELADELQKRGIAAVALHGDLNQSARSRVMNGFRSGVISVLVATDVAARGLDIDDIEMIINYDIPQDDEYYVHRIGRTGRAGKSGMAVTLAAGESQKRRLRFIERYAGSPIPQRPLPTRLEIEKKLHEQFIQGFLKELEKPAEDQYYEMLDQLEEQGFSARKVAAAFIGMALQRDSVADIVEEDDEAKSSGAKEKNMVRLFINIGKKDRIKPSDIVGCIAGESKISGASIGRVDLYDNFSFVEVEQQFKKKVFDSINRNNVKIRNRRVSIEIAKAK